MDNIHKIFIGFDHRQPVSFTVLAHSILAKASKPVAIIPLVLQTLPIKRVGLTPFTFSRFLVPWLCDYKGSAVFLDADIVLRADITEMWDALDGNHALWVVKHEDKMKFERPAVMLFNCEHPANVMLTPEVVATAPALHKFDWLGGPESPLIGNLDPGWNFLEHYQEPPLNRRSIKLVHYTQGVPYWPETADGPFSEDWHYFKKVANGAIQWEKLMGDSVHATHVLARLETKKNDEANQ